MGIINMKTFLLVSVTGIMFSGNESPKAVAIALDSMNVLYVGIDNPISIAVSEVADKDVVATISKGELIKTNEPGKYICRVERVQGSRTTIRVSVKKRNGSMESVGYQEYRIREIPNPELMYGTLSSGRHSRAAIMAQSTLNASLGAGFAFENFKYLVKSCKATLIFSEGDSTFMDIQGNSLDSINDYLNTNRSIKKLTIYDAKAELKSNNVVDSSLYRVEIRRGIEIEIK